MYRAINKHLIISTQPGAFFDIDRKYSREILMEPVSTSGLTAILKFYGVAIMVTLRLP